MSEIIFSVDGSRLQKCQCRLLFESILYEFLKRELNDFRKEEQDGYLCSSSLFNFYEVKVQVLMSS